MAKSEEKAKVYIQTFIQDHFHMMEGCSLEEKGLLYTTYILSAATGKLPDTTNIEEMAVFTGIDDDIITKLLSKRSMKKSLSQLDIYFKKRSQEKEEYDVQTSEKNRANASKRWHPEKKDVGEIVDDLPKKKNQHSIFPKPNLDGFETQNEEVIAYLDAYFPGSRKKEDVDIMRLMDYSENQPTYNYIDALQIMWLACASNPTKYIPSFKNWLDKGLYLANDKKSYEKIRDGAKNMIFVSEHKNIASSREPVNETLTNNHFEEEDADDSFN